MADPVLPAEPQIAESVLDLIGNTPIVKLRVTGRDLPCTVALKLETTNPGGSSKDRPAVEMLDAAERDGLLKPGGTIVEPTSGNTGVGLAIVAAQRGYRCVFVMTDKVAPEKVALLQAYGAEVVVCPVAVLPEDPASYYSTAERLVREIPGAFRPNQYAQRGEPARPLPDDRAGDLAPDGRSHHPLRGRHRHGRHDLGRRALLEGAEPGHPHRGRRSRRLGVLRGQRPAVPRRGHRRGLLA